MRASGIVRQLVHQSFQMDRLKGCNSQDVGVESKGIKWCSSNVDGTEGDLTLIMLLLPLQARASPGLQARLI